MASCLTHGARGPGQAGRPKSRGLVLGCIDAKFCRESFKKSRGDRHETYLSTDLRYQIFNCQTFAIWFSDLFLVFSFDFWRKAKWFTLVVEEKKKQLVDTCIFLIENCIFLPYRRMLATCIFSTNAVPVFVFVRRSPFPLRRLARHFPRDTHSCSPEF